MAYYTYEYIENHTKETKRLLGIDDEILKNLIEYVLLLEQKQKELESKSEVYLIKRGGGRKPKLIKEEQIILTLLYRRQNLTFQVLGLMFRVSESTAHKLFHYWQNILRDALPSSLIEQGEREGNIENILDILKEKVLLIDSEEQPIERHLSYQEQKNFYSGKKKQHTFKNQIISINDSNKSGKIIDIIDVVAGEPVPKSDIKIYRENLDKLPEEKKLIGDKAYVGESQIITPQKKPKNS